MNDPRMPAYSVAAGQQYDWSSLGALNPERCAALARYLLGPAVLDAGCGGGAYVPYLRSQGFAAVGLDQSQELIAHARCQDPQGRFLVGSVAALPFEDRSFDSVFCFDVLEHLEDDVQTLRELCRVARHRVLITVPADGEYLRRYGIVFSQYRDPTHLRYYTESLLAETLISAGIKDFRIEPELLVNIPAMVQEWARWPAPLRVFLSQRRSTLKDWVKQWLARRLLADCQFAELPAGFLAVIDCSVSGKMLP